MNGRYAEAWKQIESALEIGIRDAKLLYHAGAIAAKLGNESAGSWAFSAVARAEPGL